MKKIRHIIFPHSLCAFVLKKKKGSNFKSLYSFVCIKIKKVAICMKWFLEIKFHFAHNLKSNAWVLYIQFFRCELYFFFFCGREIVVVSSYGVLVSYQQTFYQFLPQVFLIRSNTWNASPCAKCDISPCLVIHPEQKILQQAQRLMT